MENKLSVSELCYSYEKGKGVLHGLTTVFTPGKITALIGANGCGKSTLLNLLAGVLKPDSGRIYLGDQDIRTVKRTQVAQNIAVVHQSNTAPADMTVEKLVNLGRTPYQSFLSKYHDTDRAAVQKAMEDTGIEEFAGRSINALSGGQMQRVWLAMALAQETDILLLDEITTYLDIHYQLEILHLIAELNRRKGITIVMVLHDINLAFEFCDEVLVMKDGHLIAQGGIADVVTEDILEQAFDVSARIISVDGKRHCTFGRKGEQHGQ